MDVPYKKAAGRALGLSCAGMMALSATSVQAADSGQASDVVALQEVVVTAQRREENLQAVPIAVSTVTGAELEERGAVDIRSISAAVPNLTTTGTTAMNVYIRGVGANSSSPNNEPSAATYIDGVYMPSHIAVGHFALNKVERIEVLKGPQGTLFGRNATAGVIQIITPDPKREFTGNVSLGYGNYESATSTAYLTGGLTDSLAADLSLLYENQGTGWGHNLTNGAEIYRYRNVAARSKWLYAPSESTRISAAVDFAKFHGVGTNSGQMAPGSVNSLDRVTGYSGEFDTVGDLTSDDNKQYGASMRIDQDFGALHGVSISAYRKVKGNWVVDGDNSPVANLNLNQSNNSDFVQQEFQLSNRNPGRVSWLAGAFLFGSTVDNPRNFRGTSAVGGYRFGYGRQKLQSGSVFGEATAELVTDTKLTLGLRYTDETLKFDGYGSNAVGVVNSGPFALQFSSSPFTWRVALDRQFAPDVLGYVSYNHGFKSGGYNLATPGAVPFFPETVDAYEVGLKSEFLDRRVRLNTAVFYYDYKDIQVVIVPGGGTQIFTNAGAARNYGLDAGLDFAATAHLTLSAGVGLLNAKFTDYPSAQGFTNLGVPVPIPNAKGNHLAYSPPFSGYASGNYRIPTSIGDFKASASLSFTDTSFAGPDEGLTRSSYFLLNSSLEWWSQSAKPFGVRLWGRNLTDSYYAANRAANNRGWTQTPGAPRMYGLSLLKEF